MLYICHMIAFLLVVIHQRLIMSGDVELNPGPLDQGRLLWSYYKQNVAPLATGCVAMMIYFKLPHSHNYAYYETCRCTLLNVV